MLNTLKYPRFLSTMILKETHLLYVRCAFSLFLLKGIKKNPFITKSILLIQAK